MRTTVIMYTCQTTDYNCTYNKSNFTFWIRLCRWMWCSVSVTVERKHKSERTRNTNTVVLFQILSLVLSENRGDV